jgi:hypothetical protein
MSCGGGHLGFPIGIQNRKFVEDLPMIIPGTLNPIGKCSNAFFSETTNMIKAKLYMNVHWMVLYKIYVFCSDMKFKIAATAGLSLTLDPMGKFFQNASSLKPLAFMYSLALIIFVVSEKAFEHFLIGSNVNLCIAVAAILDFQST